MDRAETQRGEFSKGDRCCSMGNPAEIPLSKSGLVKEDSRRPPVGNTASEQKAVEDPQPEENRRFQQNLQDIAPEIEMLRQQIKVYQQDLSNYRERAKISQARANHLEFEKKGLTERCKDAESTLLRLRPQRQQCTESEVKEDFESLKGSIQTWVDNHCIDFLDDERLGCDMIGDDTLGRHSQLQNHEIVLQNFHSQPNHWDDAKDQLLIATIMRYVVDRILTLPYPVGLSVKDRAFLGEIEESMESLQPRRDLQTRRNWKSDTIAALLNCHAFADDRADSAKSLAEGLFFIVRRTLPNSKDRDWASEVTNSLLSEVIEPSQALAQKIQCALTQWHFEYSPFWNSPPGQSAKALPHFFDNIANFQCHNLSENRKTLKPANDLATRDQKNRLIYILDLYPGLYCARVDVDKFKPVLTITQPVLLVGFTSTNLHRAGTAPQPRARSEDGGQAKGPSAAKKASFFSRILGS